MDPADAHDSFSHLPLLPRSSAQSPQLHGVLSGPCAHGWVAMLLFCC